MKAIRAHEWCTPRGLTIDEIDQPQPADRQILVRVNAAGLNFPDLLIITGKYQFKPALPFSPGFEIAGTVEKIGPAVTKFREGHRVAAQVPPGGSPTRALKRAIGGRFRMKKITEAMELLCSRNAVGNVGLKWWRLRLWCWFDL